MAVLRLTQVIDRPPASVFAAIVDPAAAHFPCAVSHSSDPGRATKRVNRP
jgi:hypothetical protein